MILLYMPSKIYNKKYSKKMRPKLSRKKNKTFKRTVKKQIGGEPLTVEKMIKHQENLPKSLKDYKQTYTEQELIANQKKKFTWCNVCINNIMN